MKRYQLDASGKNQQWKLKVATYSAYLKVLPNENGFHNFFLNSIKPLYSRASGLCDYILAKIYKFLILVIRERPAVRRIKNLISYTETWTMVGGGGANGQQHWTSAHRLGGSSMKQDIVFCTNYGPFVHVYIVFNLLGISVGLQPVFIGWDRRGCSIYCFTQRTTS
jgi:hypothetical protein